MAVLDFPFVAFSMGGLTTLAAAFFLWRTQSLHGRFSHDGACGIQKFHTQPTPRIGGLALLLGLIVAWKTAPGPVAHLLGPMLLAASLAFGAGFAEDLTKRVSVRDRLLATMGSGLLAALLTGTYLTRVDVWVIDDLLAWMPVAVAFTVFAVAGVANAVNIIDGFNGLAGGVLVIAFAAMGWIAWQVGDTTLFRLCLILEAVTLGFLLVNFPFGKIFLGDGGAYLMGFLLAWTAVLLAMRNPGVSVWAPLLCCGYPVLETGFSMARRHARSCQAGQPDRLHLHSLIHLRVSRKKFRHLSPTLRNAAVAPFSWGYALLPAGLAVLFFNDTPALIASFLFCAFVYACCYTRLTCFRWKWPSFRTSRPAVEKAAQTVVQH